MKLFATTIFTFFSVVIFAIGPSNNNSFEGGYGYTYLKNLDNLGSTSINPLNHFLSLNLWASSGKSANTIENDALISFNYSPQLNFNNPNSATGNSYSFFLEPIGWDYLENNKKTDIIWLAGFTYGRTTIKLDNEKFSNSFWGIVSTIHFRTFIKKTSIGVKLDGILEATKPYWKAKEANTFQPNGIKQHFVQTSFCIGYHF